MCRDGRNSSRRDIPVGVRFAGLIGARSREKPEEGIWGSIGAPATSYVKGENCVVSRRATHSLSSED